MKKREIGIYVHIPFCKRKCYYCDFISYAGKKEKSKMYVRALLKEIEYVANCKDSLKVKTIYIGGGTPSFIESKYIVEILKTIKEKFNVQNNAEITIEVNPRNSKQRKVKRVQKCRN